MNTRSAKPMTQFCRTTFMGPLAPISRPCTPTLNYCERTLACGTEMLIIFTCWAPKMCPMMMPSHRGSLSSFYMSEADAFPMTVILIRWTYA